MVGLEFAGVKGRDILMQRGAIQQRVLLIVDFKLQPNIAQHNSTTTYMSIDHFMGRNRVQNTKEILKKYLIQLAASVDVYENQLHVTLTFSNIKSAYQHQTNKPMATQSNLLDFGVWLLNHGVVNGPGHWGKMKHILRENGILPFHFLLENALCQI